MIEIEGFRRNLAFKDNANDPDAVAGWDGARSARLGADILQPVLQSLRA